MRPALALLLAFCLSACDVRVAETGQTRSEAGWSPLGLQLRELPLSARNALGVSHGVMVTKVREPASRSRILPGDVILRVNQTPVRDLEDFNRLVSAQGGHPVGLFVRRSDADLYIPLEAGGELPQPDELFKARRAPTGTPLRT